MVDAIGTPETVADAVRTAIGEVALHPPTRLERGFGNEGWLVATSEGRRLVKIAVRWPGGERQRNAAEAARLAQRAGVTTPQALALVANAFAGRGFGIWEFLDGRDAADALESFDASARDRWFVALGTLLACLHAESAPSFAGSVIDEQGHGGFEAVMGGRLDRVLGRYEAAELDPGQEVLTALDALVELVKECVPAARPALVHNDIYLDNLIVRSDGAPMLVDFEHARFLDALQDFVKPALFIERRFPGAVAAMRGGYERNRPAPAFDARLRLATGLELVWGLPFFHQWGDKAVVDLYRAELSRWIS